MNQMSLSKTQRADQYKFLRRIYVTGRRLASGRVSLVAIVQQRKENEATWFVQEAPNSNRIHWHRQANSQQGDLLEFVVVVASTS
jgi:hypothetical protein